MSDQRCLICLKALKEAEGFSYHEACSRNLFGGVQPPELPYSRADLNALAEKVVRRRVSVPGVQPKLSLHLERELGGHGRLTLVGMEGDYILKPPVSRYPEMPELEHLTMQLAGLFGIDACSCGLIALADGARAFIARRMDRVNGGTRHMEDMCQLTDRLTERKYSGSVEQVGKVVLRYCSNSLFDALRLFELTMFCFLTGNADMHLKNYSLIYDPGGEIRLSPAYDLLPTTLLLPEDPDESALAINGKHRRLKWDDFLALAESLRLNEKQVRNVRDRFERQVPSGLRFLSHGCCSNGMRQKYETLIKERFNRLV